MITVIKVFLFILSIILLLSSSIINTKIIRPKVNSIMSYRLKTFCNIIVVSLLFDLFFFLSIWMLTFYFAWEIFLIVLIIDLVPSIIISLMHSSENARDIEVENALLPQLTRPLFNLLFLLILLGLGIFMFIFEGIIYFEVEVITTSQIMKIISSLFIISSISLLLIYSIQIASTLSPLIGTRTRRNNILSGANSLFRFTLVLFFILWANGINLFDPIFVLFGIEFYWFYIAIAISLLLFFCSTIFFTVGERRRKNIELEFLKKRTTILSELEDSIDLQNINESKIRLNTIIESLDTQKNDLQRIIDNKYDKVTDPLIIEAIKEVVLEKQDDEVTLEDELKETISSMESNTLEHIDFINKLIQEINFCINSSQESDCLVFRNQISSNIIIIKQAYKQTDTRPAVAFKWTAIMGLFWTVTSSLLNVSLSSIFEEIVSTVI